MYDHPDEGDTFPVDATIDSAGAGAYDALVLPVVSRTRTPGGWRRELWPSRAKASSNAGEPQCRGTPGQGGLAES